MKKQAVAPIRNFTDLQSFLNAHIVAMKKRNPNWSIGTWHLKLGTGSRTTLLKIVNGQRIPGPKMSAALVKYFDFKPEESEHFQSLIQLKKSGGNRKIREAILAQLQNGTESVPVQGLDKATQALLTHWYRLPLLAMIHSKIFEQSPTALASRFRELISAKEIEKAINQFLESGLIDKRKDGRLEISRNWQMLQPVQLRPQNPDIEAARLNFFQEQLVKTQLALPAITSQESDLRAICVTINRSNVSYARELLRKFTEQFSDLVSEERGEDVYQLQIQFIPLTKQTS